MKTMTETQKSFILEAAIARFEAGDSREQVRAAVIDDMTALSASFCSPLIVSEAEWQDLLNKAVLEEARRHNAALPDLPDAEHYSPGPVNFDTDIISITREDGEWSSDTDRADLLDRERHILPKPGSKVIHSKGGIITSELLPDTWEGVKAWQARRRKQMESNHAE